MTTDCKELSTLFPEFKIPEVGCCDPRFSIVCDNDRVTRLEWPAGGSRPKLARAMPNISKLTALVYLDLSIHDLTGEFPNYIFGFTKLQQIHLNRNQFTGQLSEDVGNLQDLILLSLFTNQLTGPAPSGIGNLKSLKKLELQHNFFSGPIPASFGQLESMEYLDLSFCSFSGSIPATLGNARNLQLVFINYNQLIGAIPPQVLALPNLKRINAYNNRLYGEIDDSFKPIARADMSLEFQNNYFRGVLPEYLKALGEILPMNNCFSSVFGGEAQRPQSECDEFYKSLQGPTTNPAPNPITSTDPIIASSIASVTSTSSLISSVINSTLIDNNPLPTATSIQPTTQSSASINDAAPPSGTPPGLIIGAVVGALILIAIACTILYVCMRRKRNEKDLDSILNNTVANFSNSSHLNGGARGWNEIQNIQSVGDRVAYSNAETFSQASSSFTYPAQTPPPPKSVEAGFAGDQTRLFPDATQSFIQEKEEPVWATTSPVQQYNHQPTANIVVMPEAMDNFTKQPISTGMSALASPAVSNSSHSTISTMRQSPLDSKSSYIANAPYQPTLTDQTATFKEASTWTPSQVAYWLESVDVSSRLATMLKEHGVTGYQLILMTEERLLEMGIELSLSRRMVMEAVEMLRVGSSRSASAAGNDVVASAAPPQYYG
ncbi:hypothetical protein HDU97_002138 [Phlyctochytrium planicorne]|nr:hypothetical protein HDU97_002138 [Phlyctochytrium planicorne]